MSFIQVRHNIEVAHRLYNMKGKCESIHGHSMWVELKLHGMVNADGVLTAGDEALEFGHVKELFRGYLDEIYDHHLLLNESDPWAGKFAHVDDIKKPAEGISDEDFHFEVETARTQSLPGLRTFSGDPTTENLAKWIAQWASKVFNATVDVTVHETAVNAAGYSVR